MEKDGDEYGTEVVYLVFASRSGTRHRSGNGRGTVTKETTFHGNNAVSAIKYDRDTPEVAVI